MNSPSGNTVVVTGGGSGIGLALAKRFLADGNTVVLVGRRTDVLEKVKASDPRFHILQGDVATAASRQKLFDDIIAQFPAINIIVNNAGIQRAVDLLSDSIEVSDWLKIESEIDINLHAPIHLSMLFSQYFVKNETRNPVIMNVTSGLAFIPLTTVPVYSSTKAALHSFTWSLRHQMAARSAVKVVEIVPPAVDTDLQAPGLHTFGVPVDEFADSVYARVRAGEEEVGYGMAEAGRLAYRKGVEPIFNGLNKMHFQK
eukprot:TRINITY_DN13657_c0_g1_i1.p1 TRINITY_DN13657_c0_g1~~TRINITY_DN13657_c0_g1_i1.p1  ORF type:complete len:257 (+),score=39.05 TRINITY_DN13657_c0_g1_i1:583-1353(+)